MGQVLHRGATTTEAIRRAIQHSQESLRTLAHRHGINPKTVAKWRKRCSVSDLRTGPKHPRSTVLTVQEEAVIIAFRRHTLLPLDDCLYALQATIPHLTRSSLHRCLERHGISRLPEVEGSKPGRKKFQRYPIGYFHIDLAEVRTAEGKLYLFVAIDRTSKFAFVELVERADMQAAARFLEALVAAVLARQVLCDLLNRHSPVLVPVEGEVIELPATPNEGTVGALYFQLRRDFLANRQIGIYLNCRSQFSVLRYGTKG